MNARHLASSVVLVASLGCGVGAEPAKERAPTFHAEMATALKEARVSSPSCAPLPGREVQLARDVEPILMSGCSGEFCHRLTSPSRAYAFLVNQPSVECDDSRPLVTPGDPDRSYVVDKIQGRNLCAGHPMPRGFENRLTAAEVRTVTEWICEGAPND